MKNRSRREIIIGIVGSTIGVSGCTDGPNRESEGSQQPNATTDNSRNSTAANHEILTPAPDECRESSPPQPTPTKEGLEPKTYPTYPESLTRDTAVEFSRAFERAYQFNSFLVRFGGSGYDEAFVTGGVPDWAVFEHADGYIIGVNVQVKFNDSETPTSSSTPAPSGTSPASAWYYLTKRFVLRNEIRAADLEEGENEPTFDDAEVVICTEQ